MNPPTQLNRILSNYWSPHMPFPSCPEITTVVKCVPIIPLSLGILPHSLCIFYVMSTCLSRSIFIFSILPCAPPGAPLTSHFLMGLAKVKHEQEIWGWGEWGRVFAPVLPPCWVTLRKLVAILYQRQAALPHSYSHLPLALLLRPGDANASWLCG